MFWFGLISMATCPVGHDRGKHRLAVPVGVMHGPVAGGQVLLAAGRLVLALPPGGFGLRVGFGTARGGAAEFLVQEH